MLNNYTLITMIKVALGKLKRTLKPNKSAKDKAFVALYSIKFEEGDIAIDCGATWVTSVITYANQAPQFTHLSLIPCI
ncbi:MAG: hypothetical protein CM1200mP6_04700 [Anaerolineaceae bacterium]|nr:MAG: hypothetical protein CM1200mP6_04700 [Anaerolineaceae bacterium]